ncbi:MAG: hypothetical protein JSR89_18350 [Proteobacteria bacterium]|nr:hypothetical protein [Pseudomonadota bacterium]
MIPSVDPNMIVACLDDMEAVGWLYHDLCSAIAACALRAARGDKEVALAICQRVQVLIVALNGYPDLLTAYGPHPKDRIPTELRRAVGAIPLSVAASGFDVSALRHAALLAAMPEGSA